MAVAFNRVMDRELIDELEARTRRFAVDIIALCEIAGRQRHLWSVCGQLADAAGSVAANHRAMSRARSLREFAAKLHIVHEEADEAVHWLTVLRDSNRDATVAARLDSLLPEAERLRNLFGKARATTRRKI